MRCLTRPITVALSAVTTVGAIWATNIQVSGSPTWASTSRVSNSVTGSVEAASARLAAPAASVSIATTSMGRMLPPG